MKLRWFRDWRNGVNNTTAKFLTKSG